MNGKRMHSERLTREGYHFVFMLGFVMMGAVLRDVNLLVVLGGVLMAIVVLQWRLCGQMLHGLRVERRIPDRLVAREVWTAQLTISNTRRFLASWWLVMEDKVIQLSRKSTPTHASHHMRLAAPHLQARGRLTLAYTGRCDRRGRVRLGPVVLSTRFPFGLMVGKETDGETVECLVHPAQGRLRPAWRELFQRRWHGTRRHRVQAGASDGEFFGLRSYQPGDSLRWIHWRTSARNNEIVVRQFEREDAFQANLLLDLWVPDAGWNPRESIEPAEDQVDHAIELVACLIRSLLASSQACVSLAVCGDSNWSAMRLQSRNQILGLMDALSLSQPGSSPNLQRGLADLERSLRGSPHVLVISTRAKPHGQPPFPKLLNLRWLNVSAGEADRFFQRSGMSTQQATAF
jgi:uncharacterized protein (DUF58 family)